MIDDLNFSPGDTDNNLLRKILGRLGLGLGTGSGLTVSSILSGSVGGFSEVVTVAPTVTAASYSAGNAVGGKQTLANAVRTASKTAILDSITLLDRSNSKATMEIVIFDSDPSAATITDKTAFVFNTDDLKVLARLSVAATDYVTINSKAIVTLKGLGVVVKAASGTSLYAALITTGTPTFAATTDIQLKYGFLQDA